MANDPCLIAYSVKEKPGKKTTWLRIGVAFPHDKSAGLTVILNALPFDGRIVLVERHPDFDDYTPLPPAQLPPRE